MTFAMYYVIVIFTKRLELPCGPGMTFHKIVISLALTDLNRVAVATTYGRRGAVSQPLTFCTTGLSAPASSPVYLLIL